ncbi:MAG: M23 family metallopeptidase [Bacteroidota bacterium]|nr:M23 family metallopeptidase [Bacteroidota bacterium]
MKAFKKIIQVLFFAGMGFAMLSLFGGTVQNLGEEKTRTADRSSPKFSPAITTDLGDYLWPINVEQRITSNFAEFRSTHFHGGIDIGTHDRTGAEVYAARDGYVASVSVSPYGYGRWLVIRHPDGYYTTYAHLSSFNPTIERLVHEEQMRKGKFSVELRFAPGAIAVHKGELVAYSGESGEGSAHLHFEIRDAHFNPVNPFLCPAIKESDDATPPIFRRLAVVPLTARSLVDYEFSPQIFHAQYVESGEYKIPGTLRCTGTVGFEVDAQDKSAASRYMRGIYKLQFQVDGKALFESVRNKFPIDATREIGLEYDWGLWRQHRGEFEKLYIDRGNTLPFHSSTVLYDGAVSSPKVSEGVHSFKIVATDFSGNTSALSGTFVLNHPPALEILGADDAKLKVYVPHLDRVQSVTIKTKKLSSSQWHEKEYDAKDIAAGHDSLSIPLDDARQNGFNVVRLTATNIWGTTSFPSYYLLERQQTIGRVWIDKEFTNDFLKISVCSDVPLRISPVAEVQQGETIASVPLHAVNEMRYDGVYRLSDTYCGKSFIKAYCEIRRRGGRLDAFDSFTIISVTPESGGVISSGDGNFVAEFPPGAVFVPIHLDVKKVGEAAYSIEPRDQLLHGGYSVTLHYPSRYDGEETSALYIRDRGEWNFTHARRDARSRTFYLRNEHSLGEFRIFTDTKAPTIRRWDASHVNRAGRPLFSFSVRDNFSGVDADEINVFMNPVNGANGERVIPEYDPERHRVFFVPFEPVPRGQYTVSIEVKDRAGNAAHAAKLLTVFR